MPDEKPVSNWREAHLPDVPTIRIILELQRDYYMLTGSWPTAEQILANLKGH
jgi:hypothetical protein